MSPKLKKVLSGLAIFTLVFSELAIPIQLWNLQAPESLKIPYTPNIAQAALPAPGGFDSNITMWYKADDGYNFVSGTSATWDDLSGNGHTLDASTLTGSPSAPDFVNASINFNPTIDFNGLDDGLAHNFDAGEYPIGDFSAYTIMKAPSETSATALWQYSDGGNNDQGIFIENLSNTTGLYIDDAFINGNMLLDDNQTNLVTIVTDTTNSESRFYKNGLQTGSDPTLPNTAGDGCFGLGIDQDGSECADGGNHLDGEIAEMVLYGQTTEPIDQQKIESYLALKYGITLDQSQVVSNDGTGDYVDTQGNVIFDAHDGVSINAYNQNIFGIGNDTDSGLDQQISKSESSDSILTISTDSDLSSANGTHTSLSNGEFLILASNGDSVFYQTSELDTATYKNRIGREWQVTNTNNVGSISLKFDNLETNQNRTSFLLSDIDGDFSTTGDQTVLGTLNENGEINNVTLTNNIYLTVALNTYTPGGVDNNLDIWFYADTGYELTSSTEATWLDQSGNNFIAGATVNGVQNGAPALAENSLNFNKSLEFGDGGGFDDGMTLDFTSNQFPTGDKTIYYVGKTPSNQGSSSTSMWQYSDGGDNTDGMFFIDEDPNQTSLFLNNGAAISTGFGYNDNLTYISGYETDTTSTETRLYKNGLLNFSTPTVATPNGNGCLTLGMDQDSSECFDGNDQKTGFNGEFLVYGDLLNPNEKARVESYLAIKYGVTLDQSLVASDDGTGDYLDSQSNIIFNAHDGTSINSYNKNITIIGKDIEGSIDQQISKSESDDSILTISTDSDLSSENGTHTSLSDLQFLAIANNGGTNEFQTSELDLTNYTERISREWQATNTNNVGPVSLKFDGFESSNYRSFYLVTDLDGDFSTTGDQTQQGRLNENAEINNITLDNNIYFTIKVDRIYPGGVDTGLQAWHVASENYIYTSSTEADWLDQTTSRFDLSASNIDVSTPNAPEIELNSLNFNTSLNFSGVDDGLGRLFQDGEYPTGDKTIFTVTKSPFTGTDRYIFSYGDDILNKDVLNIVGNSTNSSVFIDNVEQTFSSNLDDNLTYLTSFETDTTLTQTRLFKNNSLDFTNNSISNPTGNGCFGLGIQTGINLGSCFDGGAHLQGLLGENIIYNTILPPLEKRKVQTYLSLKYGTNNDQSQVITDDGTGDYNDTNNNVVFDAHDGTSINPYNQNIFGIARDDEGGLNQQISRSANPDSILTISSDNNFTNTNGSHTQLTNEQYLIIGSDGSSGTNETALETDLSIYDGRISREWESTNTNAVSSISLKFDGLESTPFKTYYLVTDSDGDFSTAAGQTQVGALDANGEINNINLGSTPFTVKFISNTKGPGGVSTSVNMWYKANTGYTFTDATTSSWADQSGNGYDLSTGAVTVNDSTNVAPTFNDNGLNFNPTINFDGINDGLAYDIQNNQYPQGDISIFTVLKAQPETSSDGGIWHYSEGGNNEQALFIDANSTNTNIYLNNSINTINGLNLDDETSTIVSLTSDSINSLTTLYRDTRPRFTSGALLNTSGDGCFGVGYDQDTSECRDGNNHYEGEIAEIAVYSRTIDESERASIESYFAIKYGITTDQSIVLLDDGTGDYVDSQNNIIFNAHDGSSVNTFNNDIFAIGRDDEADLAQIISKSENSDSILTILAEGESTTNNNQIANQNFTDLDDQEFLLISNDNGSANWIDADSPSGFNILNRKWTSNETGDLGTIQLDLNVANTNFDLPNLTDGTNYYIVVDTDNDSLFTDETPQSLSDQGSDIWRATNLNLDDNQFTFATEIPTIEGPAGVTNNLFSWYTAGEGYTYNSATDATWVDQSTSGLTLTASAIPDPSAPETGVSEINFNPTIDFDGLDDGLGIDYGPGQYPAGDISTFLVMQAPEENSANGIMWIYTEGGNEEQTVLIDSTSDNTFVTINNNFFRTEFKADNNEAHLLSTISDTPNNQGKFFANGNNTVTNTELASTNQNGCLTLGLDQGFGECNDGNFHYEGKISEFAIFNGPIPDADRRKIESYFAIKYGITIDQSIANSGNNDGDYLDNSGNSFFEAHDGTNPNPFNTNIFGIGRDDAYSLSQIKSKSQSQSGILTILAEGESSSDNNNPDNLTFTDIQNQEFLMISNNGGSAGWTTTDAPEGYKILGRQWISEETGELGTIQMDFDVEDIEFNIPNLLDGVGYYLLIDTDNDGSLNDETPQLLSDQGSDIWRATNINFNENIFTLATEVVEIEFTNATGTDTETSGGNLPSLVVTGTLNSDTNIDLEILASSTATIGSDFDIASLASPLPKTITLVIPAGVYAQTEFTLNSLDIVGGGTPSFTINNDNNIETDETIILNLTNPQGALAIADTLNGDATSIPTFTYTITDNETTTISIAATDNLAQENSANGAQFTVSIDGGFTNTTGGNLTVNYTTNGSSTASSPSDYAALSGSVNIPNNSSTATINIDTSADDGAIEGTESLILDLSSVSASGSSTLNIAANPNNTATINIQDDEVSDPTISSINRQSPTNENTNATSVTYRVTFTEAVVNVDTTDFSLSTTGTALGSIVNVNAISSTVYDVVINSVTGDGTLNLDVNPGNNIQSPTAVAFNGTVTSEQTFTIDNTSPSVTVNQASTQTDPTSTDSATFTVVFSEPINTATFTSSDISLAGTTGTVTSGPTQVAPNDGTAFEFTVTGMTSVSTVTSSISLNTISDLAGNLNTASTSTDNQVTYNTTIPTISSIQRLNPTATRTNSNATSFTVNFTEPVINVTTDDFELNTTGTASGTISSVSAVSTSQYTVFINTITGDGTIDLNIAAGQDIESLSGVSFNGTITTEDIYNIDNTQPSVTVNQASGQQDPTSSDSATFTVVFSEAINTATFTSSDISLAGTTGTVTSGPTQVAPNDGTTFEFTVTGMTNGNTVSANIQVGVISDLAGNLNTASSTTDNQVSYTTSQPSISSIARLAPLAQITNANTVIFQVTFSEAVSNVSNADFEISTTGTVTSGSPNVSSINSSTYNVTVNTVAGDGSLNLDIDPSNNIESLANVALGNIISTEQEYIIDNTAPDSTVTLSAPTSSNDIDEDIVGSCGLDAANGSVRVSTDPINGFSNNYNTSIALNASGDFTISDPNWSVGTYDIFLSCTDQVGNGPTSSTAQGPVTINTTAPTVTLNIASGQNSPTNNNSMQFTAEFSEPIDTNSFSLADVFTTGSTATGITISSITQVDPNDGTTFNITITSTGDGTVVASIPAGRVNNLLGTGNQASTSTSNTVILDRVGPTPVIPTSPLNGLIYMDTPINGSCSLGAANGTVFITTTPANGFSNNYNTSISLDANGAYSIPNPNWTNNTYQLNVNCFDEAGNSGSITVNSFTIDDSAPDAPTIDNTPNSIVLGLNTNITGSCEANSTVNISSADIVTSPISTPCSLANTYSAPVTFNSLSTEPLISVNQTDPALNNSSTSTVTLLIDEDQDGVASTEENNSPNSGDSNDDGTQDSIQSNVTSSQNPNSGTLNSIEVLNSCSEINSLSFLNENTQVIQDSNFSYPLGLTSLNLNCNNANETADIKIIFDQEYNTSTWRFRTFNNSTNSYNDISDLISLSTQTIDGAIKTIATLSVQDGDSRIDQDESINSTISILLGPAIEIESTISTNQTSPGSSSSSNNFRIPFQINQSSDTTEEKVCINLKFRKKTENIGQGIDLNIYPDINLETKNINDIVYLLEQEIISGSDNSNTLKLNEFINRAEVSKILTIARDDTVEICKERNSFIDVIESDWFYDYVTNIKDKNIVHGYPDLEFKPNRFMSYAEAYKVLAIGFGLTTREEALALSITNESEWYEPYRQTLIQNTNIPEEFLTAKVESNITRKELFEALAQIIREKHLE